MGPEIIRNRIAKSRTDIGIRTNTEAKKHRGISMLIVQTSAEGFSWTPVHTMSGVDTSAAYPGRCRGGGGENRVGEEKPAVEGW